MNDTPRTDTLATWGYNIAGLLDLARQLERENNRLHKAGTDTWGELREQIHRLDAENAALRADKERLELQLAALGDLAVGEWDDKTVSAVDSAVESLKYRDQLRVLFTENPKHIAALTALVEIGQQIRDEMRAADDFNGLMNKWDAARAALAAHRKET